MSEQNKNTIAIAILTAGILIAGAIIVSQTNIISYLQERTDPLRNLKSSVASQLFDPKSAEFKNVHLLKNSQDEYCGEVNAKNRMGAYIGFQPFHAQKTKGTWSVTFDATLLSALCPSDSATANEMASKPIYYTLPEFLVNLKASGKSRFIKTTIVFEIYARDINVIESNLPKIMDAVNAHLGDLRVDDLAEKTAVAQLRSDILTKVNKIVAPAKITDVLFKEIIVQ